MRLDDIVKKNIIFIILNPLIVMAALLHIVPSQYEIIMPKNTSQFNSAPFLAKYKNSKIQELVIYRDMFQTVSLKDTDGDNIPETYMIRAAYRIPFGWHMERKTTEQERRLFADMITDF